MYRKYKVADRKILDPCIVLIALNVTQILCTNYKKMIVCSKYKDRKLLFCRIVWASKGWKICP